MIRGLYTSVSALRAAETRQQELASALANMNTPGFKGSDVTSESFMSLLAALSDPAATPGTGTVTAGPHYDLSQGPINQTGAPLDLALDGDGFFVLNGPNGALYTRSGRFSCDAAGVIRSPDGFAVQGADGQPITATGTAVAVRPDGTVLSDGSAVGSIRVVALDPSSLARAGTSTFSSTAVPGASRARVVSGALEGSNVDATAVMTSMTMLLRAFEASRQAVQLQNESLNESVNQVGTVH